MDGFIDEGRTYGFARYCQYCGFRVGGYRNEEVDAADFDSSKHRCKEAVTRKMRS